MKNVTELRNELSMVFDDLKDGKIEQSKAKELANIAGKMIKSAAVEIEYCNLMKTKKDIDFLK